MNEPDIVTREVRRVGLVTRAGLRALRVLWGRFRETEVLLYASAISFSVLLTFIPILLLFASAVGMIFSSSEEALKNLPTILDAAFPPQPFAEDIKATILSAISGIINYRTSLGLIGAGVLVVTATFLFDVVRSALHKIYRIERTRGIIVGFLHDVGFVLLTFVLLIVSNVAVWALHVLQNQVRQFPRVYEFVSAGPLAGLPTWAVVLVTAVMFYIVYRHITDNRPPRAAALASTVTMTVLWLLSGKLFSVYLSRFSLIGTIYGSYTFFLVLLLWTYYSSLIFVLGAIVGEAFWEQLRLLEAETKREE